jgi:hypothetical protein
VESHSQQPCAKIESGHGRKRNCNPNSDVHPLAAGVVLSIHDRLVDHISADHNSVADVCSEWDWRCNYLFHDFSQTWSSHCPQSAAQRCATLHRSDLDSRGRVRIKPPPGPMIVCLAFKLTVFRFSVSIEASL